MAEMGLDGVPSDCEVNTVIQSAGYRISYRNVVPQYCIICMGTALSDSPRMHSWRRWAWTACLVTARLIPELKEQYRNLNAIERQRDDTVMHV